MSTEMFETPADLVAAAADKAKEFGDDTLRDLFNGAYNEWAAESGGAYSEASPALSWRDVKMTPVNRAVFALAESYMGFSQHEDRPKHDSLCPCHAESCCPWMGECDCQCACDFITAVRDNEAAHWNAKVVAAADEGYRAGVAAAHNAAFRKALSQGLWEYPNIKDIVSATLNPIHDSY